MKKIVIKRITALLVCLVLTLGILPSVSFSRAADSITIGEFNERLEEYIKKHPDGSKYKNESGDKGTSCFGAANNMARHILNTDAPTSSGSAISGVSKNWKITYGADAIDNLHAGDVVRYRGKGNYDHSIYITKVDGDEVTYSEANYDWENSFRHGETISRKDLAKKVDKALYGNSEKKGWVAHYKGWYDCTWDHSAGAKHEGEWVHKTVQKSNGEYCAVCKNCGEEFKLPKMKKQEGLYTFKAPSKNDSNANGIGSAPYAPACNHIGAEGEQVVVIGFVTNAYGNKWFVTKSGEYIWDSYLSYQSALPKPAAPTNLKYTLKDGSKAKISWSDSPYATRYEVQYRRSSDKDFKTDQDYKTNTATKYTTTGLGKREYVFRIRAVNDTGKSDWVEIRIKNN